MTTEPTKQSQIRVTISGSESGLERLRELIASGELSEIAGFPVLGIEQVETSDLAADIQAGLNSGPAVPLDMDEIKSRARERRSIDPD